MRIFTLVALSVLLLMSPASAAEKQSYPVETISKFFRGLENIGASPLEIPVNMYKQARRAEDSGGNASSIDVGYFTGLFVGIGFTVARIGVGIADVITFPVPTQPILQPATPDGLFATIDKDSGIDFPPLER